MKFTRERVRHAYTRGKHLARQAWNTTERILSVADRAAVLAAKGMNHLGDRLDPDVKQKGGTALYKYFETRQKMENVKDNVQKVGRALQDHGFNY